MTSRSSAPKSKRQPWWILLAGLTIAYSPYYLNQLVGWAGVEWGWLNGPPSVLVWNWVAVAALAAFIYLVEHRTLDSILMVKPGVADLWWAVIFWAVATVASGVVHAWLPPPPSDGLQTILALSIPTLVFLIFTTSFAEEILYRGYSIERLTELIGHRWTAVTLSFAIFVAPHLLFFGVHWLLYQGLNVALIYTLYLWRRNLWACMLMHLLGNAMILFPAFGLA